MIGTNKEIGCGKFKKREGSRKKQKKGQHEATNVCKIRGGKPCDWYYSKRKKNVPRVKGGEKGAEKETKEKKEKERPMGNTQKKKGRVFRPGGKELKWGPPSEKERERNFR